MIVTIEISYYPLVEDINKPINIFIQKINESNCIVEPGKMSTVITGDYTEVMELLTNSMRALMDNYPSVFNLKISNSCIA